MDVNKIVAEFKKKYPGKKVIITDPKNPGEIICETKPTEKHPDWSESIAVIDYTRPHFHQELTEVYEVIKGKLTVCSNNKSYSLKAGESITLKPGITHSAKGQETWVRVYSMPGWTAGDHILVFPNQKISRTRYDKED